MKDFSPQVYPLFLIYDHLPPHQEVWGQASSHFAIWNDFLTGTASNDDVIGHNGWKLEEDWAILIEAQSRVNQSSLMGKDGLGGWESKGGR